MGLPISHPSLLRIGSINADLVLASECPWRPCWSVHFAAVSKLSCKIRHDVCLPSRNPTRVNLDAGCRFWSSRWWASSRPSSQLTALRSSMGPAVGRSPCRLLVQLSRQRTIHVREPAPVSCIDPARLRRMRREIVSSESRGPKAAARIRRWRTRRWVGAAALCGVFIAVGGCSSAGQSLHKVPRVTLHHLDREALKLNQVAGGVYGIPTSIPKGGVAILERYQPPVRMWPPRRFSCSSTQPRHQDQ